MTNILKNENLLSKNGFVIYQPNFFSEDFIKKYYVKLFDEINWQSDVVNIFGKEWITKRKVAFYGDKGISYQYSGQKKIAKKWTDLLLEIKAVVEEFSGQDYNACLLNLYHNGLEGMNWHADNEKEILKNSTIASLSFGAQRKFGFRHNESQETISLLLENGSLLLMGEEIQNHWKHKLYTSKKIEEPRINLTFRKMHKENK